ncbi:MAG: secretin and TonB N-terminal domain-containing protein [Candidatus Omnitrophica bacterium]|nr:secretin and TonB N-terminal domain-containing protein [Candidatus Omnitrophota bacterium]
MNRNCLGIRVIGVVVGCLIALPLAFAETTPPSAAEPDTTVTLSTEASVTVTAPVPQPEEGVSQGTNPDTISLDFKDADIASVLRILSMKSNINIVTGPEVKGLVTVRLDNVPWEKALDVILRTYDYVYERDGNVIRVTTRDRMKLEPVETRTFVLNYSKAAEIQSAIQDMLTERGKIKVAARTNMVVVTDIPTNLYRIGDVIQKLDKVTEQAYIDSKIVKTDLSNTEKLGIDWTLAAQMTGASRPTTFPFPSDDHGIPASAKQFFPLTATTVAPNPIDARNMPIIKADNMGTQPTFTYGTLDFSSFAAVLNLLETRVNTKVVSNPRIVVLNNQTAMIQVGQEIPVPSFERNETTGSMEVTGFNYRNTGVVLNVTPHINTAEEILVDLTPEVSAVGINQEFGVGQIQAPRFDTTKAKTQVLIESGQTIAIGGLLTDQTNITEKKVPWIGDIPLVGKIFRSKNPSSTTNPSTQKVETLFFVTVTTVDSQGQTVPKKDTGKDESQQTQAGSAQAQTAAAPAPMSSSKIVVTSPTPGVSAA